MRGSEAAAIAVAVDHFKKIYSKPDLRHYALRSERHGNEIEITFVADQSKKRFASDEAGTGGGSIYGPDMTYIVSLSTLKVLRFHFYR